MRSNRPVSNGKIIQLGHLLEYSSITSFKAVFDSLNCSDCKIISIMLKLYPVYYVKSLCIMLIVLNICWTYIKY